MSNFYVIDSTIRKNGKNPVLLFESVQSVVKYLEGMCQRRFGQPRPIFMSECESLGFGADEPTGRSFFDQMEQYFTIGVIRANSTPVKCNIFEAVKSYRENIWF